MGGAANRCSAFSVLILDIVTDICGIILALDGCDNGCNNDDDE